MSLTDSSELKGLQSQLSKLEGQIKSDKEKVGETQRVYSAKLKQKQKIQDKINALQNTTKDIIVSEHAILRYLEKVKGMDMEAIRKEIVSEQMAKEIEVCGSGEWYNHDNEQTVVTVVKNKTVVTVYPQEKH